MKGRGNYLLSEPVRSLIIVVVISYTIVVLTGIAALFILDRFGEQFLSIVIPDFIELIFSVFLLALFSALFVYVVRSMKSPSPTLKNISEFTKECVKLYLVVVMVFIISILQFQSGGASRAALAVFVPLVGTQVFFMWMYWKVNN